MAANSIKDMVEPVPEVMLEGKTTKEKNEIARGYRALTRLQNQEQHLATQAYLKSAQTEQAIPKPHRRVPKKDQHHAVKIGIPKALQNLGNRSQMPSLKSGSGLKSKKMDPNDTTMTSTMSPKRGQRIELATVELKGPVKNPSPSERIALLYTPTSNIRTTGRNDIMRTYDYHISYRNVEPLPPPKKDLDGTLKGTKGTDPTESHFLPLEDFDDTELEPLAPQEWVEMGGEEGTPARSRFFAEEIGEDAWAPCRVVGYNDDDNTFLIVWNHSGRQKNVKRLNLIFDVEPEDEEVWFERYKLACEMRCEAESKVRLHLYIEGMDDNLIAPVDEEQVDRILSLVASEFPLSHLHVVEKAIAEMRAMYTNSLKRAVYEYQVKSQQELERLAPLRLPPVPEKEVNSVDELLGTIDIPHHDYQDSKESIEIDLFQTHALLYPTLISIHGRWLNFADKLICNTIMAGTALPCELHVFEDIQARNGSRVSDSLKDDWSVSVATTIQNDLDLHFNFYEEKIEKYLKSRMCRFCRLVNVMMTSQLRQLLVATINDYTTFLKKYRVRLPEDFDLEADVVQELESDCTERQFWEARAEQVRERREAAKAIEEAAVAEKADKKPAKRRGPVDEEMEQPEETPPEHATDRRLFEFDDITTPAPYSARILHMTQVPNGIEPLFVVRLISNGDTVMFSPLLEEVEDKVKGVFDNFFAFTEDIRGVGEQLFPLLGLAPYFLKPLDHHEDFVKDAKEIIHRVLLENIEGPRQLQQMYQTFEYILKVDIEAFVEEFAAKNPTQADFNDTLERLHRDKERIKTRSLNEVKFEMIQVESSNIKNALIRKAGEIGDALMKLLTSQLYADTNSASASYAEIYDRIGQEPKTPEELQEHKLYIDTVPGQLTELWDTFMRITDGYELLEHYKYFPRDNEFQKYWHAFEWPKKVNQVLEDSEFKYKEYRNAFQLELRENCERLTDDITSLAAQVEQLSRFGDESKADDYYEQVKVLQDKIKKYQADIQLYNSRELLFGMATTQWSHIKDIKNQFEPYCQLWEITFNFNTMHPTWLDNQFTKIDADSVELSVNDWTRKLNKLSKSLSDPAPQQVAASLRQKLDNFRPHLPLIKALRNPGLRQQHWKEIARFVGSEAIQIEGVTLSSLLAKGLGAYITEVEEISEIASKTHQLESKLETMTNEWKKVTFEIEPWVNETYKLKASEEIQQMLDDHTMKTQSILGSPYVRNTQSLEKAVKDWERTLNNIQSVIDEWFKCQATWAYLEPIFSSSDISKSMPAEALKFQQVDQSWRHIMDITKMNPNVQSRCQEEKLLSTFQENNEILDVILKRLHQFLETKRMAFPRFYFISNEELLEILSESKDPYLVQPYLGKCFEGIKTIVFADSLDITAMNSAEGEQVQFVKKVNPSDHNNAVEVWLKVVEDVMCDSIKDHCRRARDDYKVRKRTDFIRAWPGQVVLAICTVFWTMETTEAMVTGGRRGLEKYEEQCKAQLHDLVLLVRDQGLGVVERCTLEALVVIEVHAKDIITELVEKNISNPNEFDWLAQLRYYWEDNNLKVKQINAVLQYGYEYLGNTGRLVITQLTDRCYRTLMGALHLNYGGAPEGPAGTGKTETTKDLAKALAKQCVVYNCSDQITYKDMAKLFKGLSQSGAWGCFDEFNRIEVQVLSVIAQQVATIQDAIATKKMDFLFDGVMMKLKMGSAVFITMNPGYAGRAELPDNLKALFRPVAMMVPNYAMIGEIQLFSYGFLVGRSLARKIVATYRLCSEQLSSQDHYDYGMRAVKAVLTAAGRLKRAYPNEDEQILMLRSIQDVNLPKFLFQDVALFGGIVSDLFPGVKLPEPDYAAMSTALEKVSDQLNVQYTEYFRIKVFQTYEMIVVRHGMMIVGFSFGAKTKVLQVLSKGLTMLNSQKIMEERTRLTNINPKSITMGQLYGKVDISGEWSDGVLAKAFRTAASDTSPDRKWLVLDGPVDAVWIENMNTVLDDNKKLCLQNGDIIPMSKSMNMIFEVQDLACASPATVSRCGMVYVEPESLGYQCLIDSWYNTLPDMLRESELFLGTIKSLVELVVDPMLEFVRKHTVTSIPQGKSTAVSSFLKLYTIFLDEFDPGDGKPKEFEERDVLVKIEGWFLFCMTWTVGGCLGVNHRLAFNSTLVDIITAAAKDGTYKFSVTMPEKRTFYEVAFSTNEKEIRYVDWLDTVDEFKVPAEAQYHEIIVPTADTVRYSFLMRTCIEASKPCLLVGDTGTGKTIMAKSLITSQLDKEVYLTNLLQFSAQTTANQTQELVDSRTERRRKGIYGPPIGKQMIVFVDDLNMPQLEVYGAQPPIELLRQWMDHRGWYNHTKDNVDFREVVDILLLCAMGPPGGGRNNVTPRFTRHFNAFSVPSFDDITLKRIFLTLMEWIVARGYPAAFKSLTMSVVQATVDVYQTLVEKLKPTPEKSHYTFNLRDVSKVFQGIAMANVAKIKEPPTLFRLWAHEAFRAFADRFINDDDKSWFKTLLEKVMAENFKMSYSAVVQSEPVVFTDLANDARNYEEVEDMHIARKALEDHLEYYNANVRGGQMDLVIFNYVLEHVARICRILKQPFGHALLVGVGGSGRTSCTKLAAKIQDYEFATVTMSKEYKRMDFLEDIKRILMKCGKDGVPTAFVLNDTQIVEESFLEDICNLLNTGEVPNLIGSEEQEIYMAALKTVAKEMGRDMSREGLIGLFQERCKFSLHIVLCFSPIGKDLRERLRKFPSLVNCTTIDWFSKWPEEGLRNVANRFLEEMDLTPELRVSIADCFVFFQESVRQLGVQYQAEARQHTYVTPTSYLELLQTFSLLLGKKKDELMSQKNRYDNGLEQLKKTEEEVELMTQELEVMKPQLKRKAKETEELILVISQESEEAEKIRSKVAVEEEAANKTATRAAAIRDDCEAKLAEAVPKLREAEDAVKKINPNELRELKGMQKPPEKVKFVMEAVAVMQGKSATRKVNQGKVEWDWWETAKKEVMTDKFFDMLLNFNIETLDDKVIDAVNAKYIANKDFDPKTIASVSKACVGLVKWVIATEACYQINKIVKPKKADLAVAEAEFEKANKDLNEKKEELRIVDEQLNKKKSHLEKVKREKQELQDKVADTDAKLKRAVKLIDGLGGERARYVQESERLAIEVGNVLGDVVVSSAFVAYLGPFQSKYRHQVLKEWVELCKKKSIPGSSPFVLEKFLGNPIHIQDWKLQALPSDSFSVDNAIVLANARRWPLLIDPQQQANKWIRNMEKNEKLVVVRPTEAEYARTISMAVRVGQPVLLENIEEDLDPVLENLLLKRVVKEATGWTITIGEPVEYNEKFRFYMTTKLPRPHYRPEISTKVTLINFMITEGGLQDQLLQKVVYNEKREVEEKKQQITIEAASNKAQLKKCEDSILAQLSAEGNLLDNEQAIIELDKAKQVSDRIAQRQVEIDFIEKQAERTRAQFVPVAHLGAILFFCVTELANIDPMYQYSLQFYIQLFQFALQDSEKGEDVQERVHNIMTTFQMSLYTKICRSLFAKDQLLFSFIMCLKINEVDPQAVRWLLVGGFEQDHGLTANPCKEWLPDPNWKFIWRASTQLPAFEQFAKTFKQHEEQWQAMYNSITPAEFDFPGEMKTMTDINRLVIVRCLRGDKIVPAVTNYVRDKLGRDYVEPPLFNLETVATELAADPSIPIIFVLSPGADPNAELDRVAEIKGMSGKRTTKLSLGQGQDKPAIELINEGKRVGNWVLLQNCHLFKDFMPSLSRIIEDYSRDDVKDALHREFRLWLTSMPSEDFPVLVLQNGTKLVQEPPKGLKSNLLRSYSSDPIADAKFFNSCNKPETWRKLLFGLCFFHSLVQERRKFGPLGWNIPYEFNDTDMRISVRQLQMFINDNNDVPYEAISYLTGQCNYGGRVTDDWDRRNLMAMLSIFYTPGILEDSYLFNSNAPEYYAPPQGDYDSYVTYIKQLPHEQRPFVFGLHPNADITKDERETSLLMEATLATQPRDSGGSGGGAALDPKTVVFNLAKDVAGTIPKTFDTEAVMEKYPITYNQSMNTVLLQELIRYNRLLEIVHRSLKDLQLAIKGEVVMSAELENVFNFMYDGKIPSLWKSRSYPSLKPFGSYVHDLIDRLDFLQKWIDHGPPPVFWISGFFFTQSFMTGVMQNFARRYGIEIDTLVWEFKVMREEDFDEAPEDGCYITGLFLEGAGWDFENMMLAESRPKELFSKFPILFLMPMQPEQLSQEPRYACPTYKTMDRRGVLSTTGHSTNFVMVMQLPRSGDTSENHWVMRGTALFTQLMY